MPQWLAPSRAGRLGLDELIMRTYSIEEAWNAFPALEAGDPLRGLIGFRG